MLLTLTTTHNPATDLGYLLHKNPARCQSFPLSFGKAHVFYPVANEHRCTAALLLDVDPVAMARRRGGITQAVLAQYVNDRPYVASSFMSVAIAQVFGSALDGRSRERPELARIPIPLEAAVEVLPCRAAKAFCTRSSSRSATASTQCGTDNLPTRQKDRIRLLHGSLMYRDKRLSGFDAAAVVEVVEHLGPPRLSAFERVVFEFAKPGTVVLTTPNREYNSMWASLPAGQFRHSDHRFEWSRDEFQYWGHHVADQHGYQVRFLPVGLEDGNLGPPTQMGVFERG